ncbi:MAG: hypothetical protein ACJAT6_001289 [Akkermansiaceae bacterium]|jgi:hypothetical protein
MHARRRPAIKTSDSRGRNYGINARNRLFGRALLRGKIFQKYKEYLRVQVGKVSV